MESWSIKGEFTLNCNCTVFCPCVLSLGEHPPTHGYCQTWAGMRIDKGHFGKAKLGGLNLAMLIDIPGRMSEGNWRTAVWIDERASDAAYDGLVKILSGQVRGQTGIFSIMVGEMLGAERAPVSYETKGEVRTIEVPKRIKGIVAPVPGATDGKPVKIVNSSYWIAPEVVVAQAERSVVRAFGRRWDLSGRSAEICKIDWRGP